MATLRRSLTVPVALDRVAPYLCDLTTTEQWDPHTVGCRRLDDGPLAVGARYAQTRAFGGHEVTIEMSVVELEPLARIVWAGGNGFADGREEISFAAADGGTTVTHSVQVRLKGVARLGLGALPVVMRSIADDGTQPLRAALLRLADPPDQAGR